jgi:hypothetical protein
VTLELAIEAPASTPIELLLEELLDREWDAQSMRTAPLEPTPTVRELLELVLAGAPRATFGVAAVADGTAATPAQLVEAVRDDLPVALAPWTLRAVRHVGSLRAPPRLLPPAEEPALLAAGEPAPPPAPSAPAPAPALPPPTVAPPPLALAPERERASRRALAIVAATGAVLGAGIGAAVAALEVPEVALGALAGLIAAALAGGRR